MTMAEGNNYDFVGFRIYHLNHTSLFLFLEYYKSFSIFSDIKFDFILFDFSSIGLDEYSLGFQGKHFAQHYMNFALSNE